MSRDEAENVRLEIDLLPSLKDRDEHVMMVDEAIEALEGFAQRSNAGIQESTEVRRMGQIMHIYRTLEAQLFDDVDAMSAIKAFFKPVVVTEVPERQAMRIIHEVEAVERNAYGGVVGLIGIDGFIDTAVILRSALMEDRQIYMRCGGGIIADSMSASEYGECLNKARTMMECVAAAESAA